MHDQGDNGTGTLTQAGDTCDLADFRRDAPAHLDQLARTGRVEILTVDGQAKGVVMAPDVFGRMADRIEQAEITEALRLGFADLDAGRVIPAEKAIFDLATKLGLDMDIVFGNKP